MPEEAELKVWSDRSIQPGETWSDQINRQLKRADVILLMISADFLASEYITSSELQQALAMHDAGETVVVPVIVRPCAWQRFPVISNLQALPRDGKPVSAHEDIDQALLDISRDIQRIVSSAEPSEGLEDERQIQLRLNIDFDSFSPEQEKILISALRKFLDLDHDPKIIKIERGSVILRLLLPRAEVERLQRATNNGELGDYSVIEAKVVVEEEVAAETSCLAFRPRVFIGSSSEGLEIAETIQLNLDHLCEVTIWTQGLFTLGSGVLEALAAKLSEFDYAILVLTPDDLTESRNQALFSPRDNVIFELGLFMGYLGASVLL